MGTVTLPIRIIVNGSPWQAGRLHVELVHPVDSGYAGMADAPAWHTARCESKRLHQGDSQKVVYGKPCRLISRQMLKGQSAARHPRSASRHRRQ